MRRTSRLIVFTLVAVSSAAAQGPASRDSIRDDHLFSFYDGGPYRAQVPRPDSVLGYKVGDAQTQFAAQERVLLAIANAARDRVNAIVLGPSF